MLRLADRPCDVRAATLELFHLFAREASWTLEITLEGAIERLALEGRVRTPALPGPSELVVWYVDAPRVVTLDGEHGTLGVGERAADHAPARATAITCTALAAGRVALAGTLELVWQPLGGGAPRPFAIALELDAALVT